MGQTLSEPVVEKRSSSGELDRFALFGVSDMQGWRISMEDAHTTVLQLVESNQKMSFFGVFDGHGGERIAEFAGENLVKILVEQNMFTKGDYVEALKQAFLETDRAILKDRRYDDDPSGCTATTALITSDTIYVANAGDSRTVLGSRGIAIPLSEDHKPSNDAEKERIRNAGGYVDFGRVNGNLALSRAIGDFEFKKSQQLGPEAQIVTAYPDVQVHKIDEDDEFLVLACDGIWDCLPSTAVVEFVRRGIAARQELHKICENLMDNCVAPHSDNGGLGCDNMTVIIVALLNGKTKEEWYDMVVKRVEAGDGPVLAPRYARFKGPGFSYFRDDDDTQASTDEEYCDGENTQQSNSNSKGTRVIVLGDGTDPVL